MKPLTTLTVSVAFFGTLLAISCVTVPLPAANSTPQASPAFTPTPQPSTPGTVNGRTITADMSDEQLLAAFDVDIDQATSSISRGKDGYSTSYVFKKQTVSITRSVVTGVAVMAFGEPIKGDWALGGR